ncbi:MAG: copper-binding protein [Telluria sp.]|jgi:Cu(I)/Ag(I) efflux system protein CusF
MNRFAVCLFALALSAGAAQAQEPQPAAEVAAPLTQAEVVKVDKDAGKITIKHAAIENLKMPAMTMAFKVADAAMLEQVRIGDKVAFYAEKVNGAFTVTRLEAAKQP